MPLQGIGQPLSGRRGRYGFALALLLAWGAFCFPAGAYEDLEVGFSLEPPAGWQVEPITPELCLQLREQAQAAGLPERELEASVYALVARFRSKEPPALLHVYRLEQLQPVDDTMRDRFRDTALPEFERRYPHFHLNQLELLRLAQTQAFLISFTYGAEGAQRRRLWVQAAGPEGGLKLEYEFAEAQAAPLREAVKKSYMSLRFLEKRVATWLWLALGTVLVLLVLAAFRYGTARGGERREG